MNFKKRVNGSWTDTPYYIHNTSTDTIATLPAVIHPTDTTATVGLKGQMLQSSVPSPTSPIMPQGCGDLETSGAKAGQYKIPISSASVTTPIYLGEVETVRYVKKLVLDGTEDFRSISSGNNKYFRLSVEDFGEIHIDTTYCTHFKSVSITSSTTNVGVGVIHSSILNKDALGIRPPQVSTTSLEGFTTYLTQQYNNGTPVTVWYVLATPTTGIVNEPLMKIGEYADEVSGISIPTIAGANTLSVGTTLQPSEVTVNYKGWHPVQSAHERENGQWD